ncbi:nucleotide-diphospho-sugar transferase [Mucilaginibacter sp. KACC 22063]|uniref:nucleotide-diphospho-sugar transferase n=1 Tax=Mucilaginibacter sp. KACC 22063 TaxID=3025666 RepID=UPI002366C2B6|nr:nucleotide-diphospho-sugar transferase [Mucilaginibacter sp. KACC 22063]WDF55168.1 nucleotide-diphospho-sugar transferase [Mucilaginibacter sp. KACC 22063]
MAYQTQSAVLFMVFNRPVLTRQVFEAISKVKPQRLYIAADGPRPAVENEASVCEQVKVIATNVNWNCEVKTLFRNENLGCRDAVSSAIDWFFENEEEGIILEDDCLPGEDFFRFCDTMLYYYRNDTRIRHVGGSNLQQGKQWGNGSYYFSNLTHVWGWASWRRVWQSYDKKLSWYTEADLRNVLVNIFSEPVIINAWLQIFNELKEGKIDTWDYQLTLINFLNNSLSVLPNVNLISNVGFGKDATHTVQTQHPYANQAIGVLGEIVHPHYVVPQKQADYATLAFDFEVERIKKKQSRLDRRIRRWLKK